MLLPLGEGLRMKETGCFAGRCRLRGVSRRTTEDVAVNSAPIGVKIETDIGMNCTSLCTLEVARDDARLSADNAVRRPQGVRGRRGRYGRQHPRRRNHRHRRRCHDGRRQRPYPDPRVHHDDEGRSFDLRRTANSSRAGSDASGSGADLLGRAGLGRRPGAGLGWIIAGAVALEWIFGDRTSRPRNLRGMSIRPHPLRLRASRLRRQRNRPDDRRVHGSSRPLELTSGQGPSTADRIIMTLEAPRSVQALRESNGWVNAAVGIAEG